MVTKKIKPEPKETAEETVKAEKYYCAVGRRKTAVAQVRIYPVEKLDKGILVNDKKMDEYFPLFRLRDAVKSPIVSAGQEGKFDVSVHVAGGGINAQAEAIRLGIARALVKFDETLRKALRDRGFLTRDARVVERKKPGLLKARRAPQWAKR